MKWAHEQALPDSESKLLLLILANYAGHDNSCWPSVNRLARECVFSESTAHRRLKQLEQLGFIKIIPRKDEKGDPTSNVYRLVIPPGVPQTPPRCQADTTPGVPQTPKPISPNLSIEPVHVHPSQEEVEDFCTKIELPVRDGEWFWNKCQGNGWTNNGKPIRDWKATIRAWKAAGYMASQKQQKGQYGKTNVGTGQQSLVLGQPDYSKGF